MRRPVQVLAKLLRERQLTIAFAESMTCGYLAQQLGNVPKTSEIFLGGIVCYNVAVKSSLLNVPASVIEKYTPESHQVTARLARQLKKRIDADICAAVTGLASPGGSESDTKPVGTVFFALYYRGKLYRLRSRFTGSPQEIKRKAADRFFRFIVRQLG
jgi:nicotinamide-nucleotide amidase